MMFMEDNSDLEMLRPRRLILVPEEPGMDH